MDDAFSSALGPINCRLTIIVQSRLGGSGNRPETLCGGNVKLIKQKWNKSKFSKESKY